MSDISVNGEHVGGSGKLRVDDMAQRFEQLCSQGFPAFDSLGYRLCEGLTRRLGEEPSEAIQKRLADRLEPFLEQAETKREVLAEKARTHLDSIKSMAPDHYSEAARLRQAGAFKELEALFVSLKAQKSVNANSLLKGLNEYLEEKEWSQSSIDVIGLDALLYDQDINDDENNTAGTLKPLKSAQTPEAGLDELKSLQHYREYIGRVVTENMVRQVIKEDPENAGPLNPQRLLVRTISAMKDISPAYVNRLVPFFDSLQWLEEQAK